MQGTPSILFKNTECNRQSDWFDRLSTKYRFCLVLGFSGFESRAANIFSRK